ncbi:MAG: thiamine pyrophosphate-dependent dehydrogenase E1 component subunit alpha [Proteobacteria bacterium]|nr:thiamine pyrophosphate-dependent dehydrogenase E1 component subunit alpha [Pseudomonadota bacterium]
MAAKKNKSGQVKIDKDALIDIFTRMVRARKADETLMEVFTAGEVPGFLHVAIGQEATPAVVSHLLNDDDYIGSTHRGHGHVVAKGMDLKKFMAEIFGRKNGFCMGRSGSMHLADASLGILGANGIVGGGIPIATGAAFAAKYQKSGKVAVAYFGDGATSEGNFHECMNMAALWKLPIVFVCENNKWAEFTPQSAHMVEADIAPKADSYGMASDTTSNDVHDIYQAAKKAIDRARNGDGPTLLEVKCIRWYGHFVGDPQKYRGKEAVEEAMKDDCLARYEELLLDQKVLTRANVDKIKKQADDELAEAVDFARNSELPTVEELAEGLYV